MPGGAPIVVAEQGTNGHATTTPDVEALLALEIPAPDPDGLLDTAWAQQMTWSLMVAQAHARALAETLARKDQQIAGLKAALRTALVRTA